MDLRKYTEYNECANGASNPVSLGIVSMIELTYKENLTTTCMKCGHPLCHIPYDVLCRTRLVLFLSVVNSRVECG